MSRVSVEIIGERDLRRDAGEPLDRKCMYDMAHLSGFDGKSD
jgi:hypothetical protein